MTIRPHYTPGMDQWPTYQQKLYVDASKKIQTLIDSMSRKQIVDASELAIFSDTLYKKYSQSNNYPDALIGKLVERDAYQIIAKQST